MTRWLRRTGPAAAVVALLAAVVPAGAPPLQALVRSALSLRRVPMDERRPVALGSWYREAEALRRRTAPGTAIDIVAEGRWNPHFALVAGAALHQRDCRYYRSWDARARGEQAAFFDGDRAVNAITPRRPPAEWVVVLDASSDSPLRVLRMNAR